MKERTMNKKIQFITKVSILGALAGLISILDISIPFIPAFYKIDLSEVITILAGFSLGVLPAICVEALKIAVNFVLNGTSTFGIGEFANFIMGLSFVLPATILYHKNKSKKQAITGLLVGGISLVIVSSFMNYFILLPTYAYFFQMPMRALIDMGSALNPSISGLTSFIIFAVIPFNILKATLTSVVIVLIYKKITPLLKK